MQFCPVHLGERTYVEWRLAEGLRIGSPAPKPDYPYVVTLLLSPADLRNIAQQLLEAAEWAEGGSGLPTGVKPPPPPPPPTLDK